MKFDAPIPGQSLTGAPKAYPWERPPEINDPEQAIALHISRLNNEDRIGAIVDMLQMEMDVKTLTEGIVRGAVANGVHSVDVGLLVAPVVHEFIVSLAEEAGIEFDEGLVDTKGKEKSRTAVEKAKAEVALEKALKTRKGGKASTPTDDLEMAFSEAPIESDEVMDEMPMEEPMAPKGLMARKN
jgi:hypothetical protein